MLHVSGLTLGQTTAATTPAAGGFTLGAAATQQNTGFQQLAKPATTISTGFNLSQTTKPAFTTPVATLSGALTLGGTPAKPAANVTFNLGGTTTSAGLTLGAAAAATPAAGGLTLGGATTSAGLTLGLYYKKNIF